MHCVVCSLLVYNRVSGLLTMDLHRLYLCERCNVSGRDLWVVMKVCIAVLKF